MSNELVNKFQSIIKAVEQSFVVVCDIETFRREASFASQIFQKQPELYEALKTKEGQQSFASSIMNVANFGVTLNPAKSLAYIIARSDRKNEPKKFCLDISYRGLLYVATRDKVINSAFANAVREGDEFFLNELDQAPTHRFDPFERNRGNKKITGAYCSVRLPDQTWQTTTIDVGEIENIRKSSPAGQSDYGPWKKYYDQMCIKTVIKRAAKLWNYGGNDTLAKAIDYLNTEAGEGIVIERNKTAKKADQFLGAIGYDDAEPLDIPIREKEKVSVNRNADEFDREYDNAQGDK